MKLYCGKAYPAPAAAAELPEWITWFPDGLAQLEDGPEYAVTAKSWELVQAHLSRRGLEVVVDYEHQTLSGKEAPAAGWCKEWRYVPGVGIQARVEWTERAEEYLKTGEYRYFSPVFELEESEGGGMILSRVHHVSLTNDPRTNNLKAIVAKLSEGEGDMDIVKQIAAMIGLPETATAEEVIAEVSALREKVGKIAGALKMPPEAGYEEVLDAVKALAEGKMEESEVAALKEEKTVAAKIRAALSLPAGSKADLVVAKIKAMQGAGDQAAGLAARLEELEAQAKKAKAKELMTIWAAKLTPAMRKEVREDGKPYWEALAEEQPEVFVQVAKNLPDAVPSPLPGKKEQAGVAAPSAAALHIAAKMGVTAEELAKYNKTLEG